MHADGGKQVGVQGADDDGHGATRRQAGDEHFAFIHRVVVDDLPRDAGDQRRFALVALLVDGIEPVPAARTVGTLRLRRIDDKTFLFFGQRIHLRAGGEIVGILRAAVQHHDQRHGLAVIAAGDIQFVGARARMVAVHAVDELRASGHLRWRGGRRVETGRMKMRHLEAGHVEAVLAQAGGHAQARHEILREFLRRLRGRGRHRVSLRRLGPGLRGRWRRWWRRWWINVAHRLRWRRLRGCRRRRQAGGRQRLLDRFGGGGGAAAHQITGRCAHLRQHVER